MVPRCAVAFSDFAGVTGALDAGTFFGGFDISLCLGIKWKLVAKSPSCWLHLWRLRDIPMSFKFEIIWQVCCVVGDVEDDTLVLCIIESFLQRFSPGHSPSTWRFLLLFLLHRWSLHHIFSVHGSNHVLLIKHNIPDEVNCKTTRKIQWQTPLSAETRWAKKGNVFLQLTAPVLLLDEHVFTLRDVDPAHSGHQSQPIILRSLPS